MSVYKLVRMDMYVDKDKDEWKLESEAAKEHHKAYQSSKPWYKKLTDGGPRWVSYRKANPDYKALCEGGYRPPAGWKVASFSIDYDRETITLMLESELEPGYR